MFHYSERLFLSIIYIYIYSIKENIQIFTDVIKKALDKAAARSLGPKIKMDSPVLISTCRACTMYLTAMQTLTQLSMDIMAGTI